jgi:nicotinate phosphoribosyltransferase
MPAPQSLLIADDQTALLTDLYELTMAAGFFENGVECRAEFELFVRDLPADRGYLVAAGLEQAVAYLTGLRFTEADVDFVRGHPSFAQVSPAFFERLRALRFTGDVFAMPEGTVVFAHEPLLRVRAPILEAQIVETFLLTTVTYQTLVATKAARVVGAAAGRAVVDFGSRRAHGPQAGVLAARAAAIGGCQGTSNVLAARRLGIPALGTAAHSWTEAFPSESAAFRAYVRVFPKTATLLIDTYDTVEGARRAAEFGPDLAAVRLDSGDLAALARAVRRILDQAGLARTRILASGDLNEFKIADLVADRAPIDGFGVGTDLVTSRDAPALGGVYKLVAIERGGVWRPCAKRSTGKATLPWPKQVFRRRDAQGRFAGDLIARADEAADGEPLLAPVMAAGQLIAPLPSLEAIAARARDQVARLDESHRRLTAPADYPVVVSPTLARDAARPVV